MCTCLWAKDYVWASGSIVELLNMHAYVCCFQSLDLKRTLGIQLALMPRNPRKAEVDSNVLLVPRLGLTSHCPNHIWLGQSDKDQVGQIGLLRSRGLQSHPEALLMCPTLGSPPVRVLVLTHLTSIPVTTHYCSVIAVNISINCLPSLAPT